MNLLLATIVSYQIAAGLPLKHDGYVVEQVPENGERACVAEQVFPFWGERGRWSYVQMESAFAGASSAEVGMADKWEGRNG